VCPWQRISTQVSSVKFLSLAKGSLKKSNIVEIERGRTVRHTLCCLSFKNRSIGVARARNRIDERAWEPGTDCGRHGSGGKGLEGLTTGQKGFFAVRVAFSTRHECASQRSSTQRRLRFAFERVVGMQYCAPVGFGDNFDLCFFPGPFVCEQ
jgi:hypothetical protein